MQNTEPVILLHKDVVNQVGCLLGSLYVLWTVWDKLKYLVAARKDTKQRRKHGKNSVANLGQNNLRATIFFIAKGLGKIVRHSPLTLRRKVAVDVSSSVFNGLGNDILKFVIVHRQFVAVFIRFRRSQSTSLSVIGAAHNAIRALRNKARIVSPRRNAPCIHA